MPKQLTKLWTFDEFKSTFKPVYMMPLLLLAILPSILPFVVELGPREMKQD